MKRPARKEAFKKPAALSSQEVCKKPASQIFKKPANNDDDKEAPASTQRDDQPGLDEVLASSRIVGGKDVMAMRNSKNYHHPHCVWLRQLSPTPALNAISPCQDCCILASPRRVRACAGEYHDLPDCPRLHRCGAPLSLYPCEHCRALWDDFPKC